MSDQHSYQSLWDLRERYAQSPPRYLEVASISSVTKLLTSAREGWAKNLQRVNYLDLGCGDGRGTRSFADFLEKVTQLPVSAEGIDGSAQCEASCKDLGLQFSCLDIGSQAIPKGNFQVVTLFETIEHVFDTDFLLRSIKKSLSDDGILLVTTMNVVCWKNRILVPLGIQPINTEVSTRKLNYGYRIKFLKNMVDRWEPAGHIRPFTLHSLQDMLQDNGFVLISSHGLENWRAFKFLERIAKNMCTGILVVAGQ